MVKENVILVCEGVKRNGLIITESIIDHVVETFQKLNYKPPIVVGHIHTYEDGDPAAGRVLSIRKVKHNGKSCIAGDLLFSPWVEKSVENGEYDGYSVGIQVDPESGKHYLHHLALLGAVPPADQLAGFSASIEKVHLSNIENVVTLEFKGIKLSTLNDDKGGSEMDIKAIVTALFASEEFRKELGKEISKAAHEAVQIALSTATKTQQQEQKREDQSQPFKNPETAELEKLYKQDKIERIKEIALSAGMGEEGVKALERLCTLFKPVIHLSTGDKLSPFDLLEKALKDIKPRKTVDSDLFKPINLSAEGENADIFDPTELARTFTNGGE